MGEYLICEFLKNNKQGNIFAYKGCTKNLIYLPVPAFMPAPRPPRGGPMGNLIVCLPVNTCTEA